MKKEPDIARLASRVVYENRWMRVREDRIRRRSGAEGIYGVVEKPDFVVIVPVDRDRVHLVEQFRYPVGGRYWEFPQGSWEQAPGADPRDVARGELLEETGLAAAEIAYAGHLFQGYGYATQGYHVFVASGLSPAVPAAHEPEEQDLVTGVVSVAELERMIRDGAVRDATTVAAFGLLRLKRLI